MTSSQNIILELKKLGIDLDMSPNKLKSGSGEGVCIVLLSLCQVSLQNKFKFKKPVIKDDGQGFGDDADDLDDDFEGNADIADMNMNKGTKADSDDDMVDEDLDFGVGQAIKSDEHDLIQ